MQDEGGDVYEDGREKEPTVGCRGSADVHDWKTKESFLS